MIVRPFAPLFLVLAACATPDSRPDPASAEGCAVPPAGAEAATPDAPRNVLGEPLVSCSLSPVTGYHRDGICRTGPDDTGRHVVCAVVTEDFLSFTKSRGNDLVTPLPERRFPGLHAGDRWCLCALRWKEALEAGVAPPVVLESTNEAAIRYVTREELGEHAARRGD